MTPAAQTVTGCHYSSNNNHREHPEQCVKLKTNCTLTVITGLVQGVSGGSPKTRGAEMAGQGLTHEQHVDLVGHEAQLTGN